MHSTRTVTNPTKSHLVFLSAWFPLSTLVITNGLCSFVHCKNLSAKTRVYQSNNYILDMNNVVDYLEFKVQTCVRGHIINSSSAPCDYHKSNSVTFEHSVSDRCEFCYCSIWLSVWLYKCHPRFFCANWRRSKCRVSLGLVLIHCP